MTLYKCLHKGSYVIGLTHGAIPLRKLLILQLVKKFPAFYGTKGSLSCQQPTLVPILSHINLIHTLISWFVQKWLNIILSSPCRFSKLFLSVHVSPSKECIYFSSPPYNAIHPIFLDFITHTTFTRQYKTWTSSLCNFLPSPTTSYLLVINTFFSLYSSLNMTYQVSHPCEIAGTATILYILIFIILMFKVWRSVIFSISAVL